MKNFSKEFRIDPGKSVDLADYDSGETGGYDKDQAKLIVANNAETLFTYQQRLYAENKRALLIILQGTDTSGKDGVIRHVIRGLNPQGCVVTSFKAPTSRELAHDFLWRVHQVVLAGSPGRARAGGHWRF
jgi:polyphosphate kinase 2 (PPK2 family)